MSPDRLIYMANQIGKFFESQGHDKAVPGIAAHIRKFWDPRMRTNILAHLDAGGTGLDPEVREALATLKSAELQPSALLRMTDSSPTSPFFRAAHEPGVGTFRTSAASARTTL